MDGASGERWPTCTTYSYVQPTTVSHLASGFYDVMCLFGRFWWLVHSDTPTQGPRGHDAWRMSIVVQMELMRSAETEDDYQEILEPWQ